MEEAGSVDVSNLNQISFAKGHKKTQAKKAGSVRRARRPETQREKSKDEASKQMIRRMV